MRQLLFACRISILVLLGLLLPVGVAPAAPSPQEADHNASSAEGVMFMDEDAGIDLLTPGCHFEAFDTDGDGVWDLMGNLVAPNPGDECVGPNQILEWEVSDCHLPFDKVIHNCPPEAPFCVLAMSFFCVDSARCVPNPPGFPKCLQFTDFCDALQIESVGGGRITATWHSWDCAGTDCPMRGAVRPNQVPSACTPADPGDAALRALAADSCPGDFYWVIGNGFDGTMDMHNGIPFSGTCWIDELRYTVVNGPCATSRPDGPQKPSFLSTLP